MNIFYNPEQARIRAGWRLLLVSTVFLAGMLLTALLPSSSLFFVRMAPYLMLALFVCWAGARFLDHRPFRDLGFHLSRGWWRDFAFGLALGGVLMLGIFLAELSLGWLTVTRVLVEPARGGLLARYVVAGAIGYMLVGFYEELIFRGYGMRNLAEGLRWRFINPRAALLLAYLLSSLVFGFMHQGNPNATPLTIPHLALAGMFMGLGYILTGELALSIGLHIAWNFFQGYVFGFAVSGASSGGSLIGIQQGGSVLWTGGAWGPEGGLVGLLGLVAGSLLIIAWVRVTRGVIRLEERLAIYEPPRTRSVLAKAAAPARAGMRQDNI